MLWRAITYDEPRLEDLELARIAHRTIPNRIQRHSICRRVDA
jgi:hypothetical protein